MLVFAHTLIAIVMCLVNHNPNDAGNILPMRCNVNYFIVLCALGWESLKTETKKAKAKMIYKVFDRMCRKSLCNISHPNMRKETTYNLGDTSGGHSSPKPRANYIKK